MPPGGRGPGGGPGGGFGGPGGGGPRGGGFGGGPGGFGDPLSPPRKRFRRGCMGTGCLMPILAVLGIIGIVLAIL